MDWFGNRIARNLPRIPLLYTHETMEDWQHLFEDSGFKTIKTIFLDSNEMLIGLVPPRGVLVFEYPALPIDVKDCAMLQPQHIVKAISASA